MAGEQRVEGVETLMGSQAVCRQCRDRKAVQVLRSAHPFSPLQRVLTQEFATSSSGMHLASITKMSLVSDICTCLPFFTLGRVPALFGTSIYMLHLPPGLGISM